MAFLTGPSGGHQRIRDLRGIVPCEDVVKSPGSDLRLMLSAHLAVIDSDWTSMRVLQLAGKQSKIWEASADAEIDNGLV